MSVADRKHPCPDCRHCQWCGDDRCRLCRQSPAGAHRKLSFAEQIALYEQLNLACATPVPPVAENER
jgi:D-arabinose 1-dehydrogenase-like Zn-dependent alcohol dehydrogenase